MVGVSGHRDLDPDDLPRLREAVTGFVQQLREQLPDTELRMIVGMAEGADLLVAQTALALGVGVEAVLPMPLDQYAADFDAETLVSLKKLLRHPEIRCVELSSGAPTDDACLQHSAAQRDAMYANLTDTLIRRSSLLLALWDGRASQLPGGTADTVLRYLGVRTDENQHAETIKFVSAGEEPDVAARLVYWTPTARSGRQTYAGGNRCAIRQGRCACRLLSTALRSVIRHVRSHGICDGSRLPDLRPAHRVASPVDRLPAHAAYRPGRVLRTARQALVRQAPDVSGSG